MVFPEFRLVNQACIVALIIALSPCPVSADILFAPTQYSSQADIPTGFYDAGGPQGIEDFEDGSLDFGITASVGSVFGPGGFADSVDGDDGTIDGSGSTGRSWLTFSASMGVQFSFSGTLPTAAGIVWTDGAGAVTFEAFDGMGNSLGTTGPIDIADASNAGTTAEDHFFGVQHLAGISAIKLSNSGGGSMEVDHVQFGFASVPEPSSLLLLTCLFGTVVVRRRRV